MGYVLNCSPVEMCLVCPKETVAPSGLPPPVLQVLTIVVPKKAGAQATEAKTVEIA